MIIEIKNTDRVNWSMRPLPPSNPREKPSLFFRYLDLVERIGNRLPNPVSLFLGLAALVVVMSAVASWFHIAVVHPGTGEPAYAFNLLSPAGLRRMFLEAITNFTSFAPLGVVLFTVLGIAVAERSGLLAALLRSSVRSVPPLVLPAVLVFIGVNSAIAGDAGFIILPPLGALVFVSVGRHPIAGLAAAFAGVAGGFSASVFVTALDVLLGALSHEAARVVVPTYVVEATANYYFMTASAFLITICGTLVTTKIVEPRLGVWNGNAGAFDANTGAFDANKGATTGGTGGNVSAVSDYEQQRRALRATLITFIICIIATLALVVPDYGILRDAENTLRPFFQSIVVIATATFCLCGLTYGVIAGTIRTDRDAVKMMGDGMSTMSSYIVLAFIIAQFVAYFKWSNLGIITAVGGADVLTSLHLSGPLLLVAFVGFSVLVDLLIGSASAKWAILAPVFIPMFMLMGFTPEAVQATYRIGDSVGNCTSPLLPYLPIVIMAARRYVPTASVGTMISTMIPYSIVFGIAWTALLLVWLYAGIPLGPGVGAFLK